jgi:hypothetical protein
MGKIHYKDIKINSIIINIPRGGGEVSKWLEIVVAKFDKNNWIFSYDSNYVGVQDDDRGYCSMKYYQGVMNNSSGDFGRKLQKRYEKCAIYEYKDINWSDSMIKFEDLKVGMKVNLKKDFNYHFIGVHEGTPASFGYKGTIRQLRPNNITDGYSGGKIDIKENSNYFVADCIESIITDYSNTPIKVSDIPIPCYIKDIPNTDEMRKVLNEMGAVWKAGRKNEEWTLSSDLWVEVRALYDCYQVYLKEGENVEYPIISYNDIVFDKESKMFDKKVLFRVRITSKGTYESGKVGDEYDIIRETDTQYYFEHGKSIRKDRCEIINRKIHYTELRKPMIIEDIKCFPERYEIVLNNLKPKEFTLRNRDDIYAMRIEENDAGVSSEDKFYDGKYPRHTRYSYNDIDWGVKIGIDTGIGYSYTPEKVTIQFTFSDITTAEYVPVKRRKATIYDKAEQIVGVYKPIKGKYKV